ncbi:hypothetical protein O6H91_15G048100 [Diphasiastrum complanatum]|uniref:Uncharacterized protein n=1 Tax=Diphasiastrum complanatum TaxID=34168 RepID=A0ACC2BJ24_DIPCM|nr:hypothetical protein O6H91_15G048100 [Diphasiastrum complanatum]
MGSLYTAEFSYCVYLPMCTQYFKSFAEHERRLAHFYIFVPGIRKNELLFYPNLLNFGILQNLIPSSSRKLTERCSNYFSKVCKLGCTFICHTAYRMNCRRTPKYTGQTTY